MGLFIRRSILSHSSVDAAIELHQLEGVLWFNRKFLSTPIPLPVPSLRRTVSKVIILGFESPHRGKKTDDVTALRGRQKRKRHFLAGGEISLRGIWYSGATGQTGASPPFWDC
ncbi:hypothetical protein CEXT_772761 [Caerostris extrusa]|uniref:Uncharacterized protein n=1 Tax=Caerostris extrusa TaxID=172846 RepID=A0AAV4UEZ4_CAEEX|nr:hypothetical protein CEXT_772761 [Caerostris extrusa]